MYKNPLSKLADKQKAERGSSVKNPVEVKSQPNMFESKLGFYQSAVAVYADAMKEHPAKSTQRNLFKNDCLAEIMPFVDEYVSSGHIYPNSVAVQAFIWLFDVGNIKDFLRVGFYLIETGKQHMPKGFKRRDMQNFLAQSFYDWANEKLKAKESTEPYISDFVRVLDNGFILHNILKGMVYAIAARDAALKKDWPCVVSLCHKALAAHPCAAGMKTLLNRAVKKTSGC